jgi:16S rRNA processing protein RimM
VAGAGEPAEPSHLVVGHVTRAHGTKGEVFVWPLTDEPDRVFTEGSALLLGTEDGELGDDVASLEIVGVRPFKRGFLLFFAGLDDRDAVEELTGRYLLVERERLAEPAADEVWYHQLLGMQVTTTEGREIGRVREVYDVAPADLLEVETKDGRTILIPATKQVVREIDTAGRTVRIEPPPGLLEI